MIEILTIVLVIVALLVGTDRTAKALFSTVINMIVLMMVLVSVSCGINAVIMTSVGCFVITFISLLYQNEVNEKSVSAAISVIVVVLILIGVIYFAVRFANIQGFPIGEYKIRETNGYAADIGVNMIYVQISVILLYLIGAVIDTSISITSSTYQVYLNNKSISLFELYSSGMKMGKDIINSTINTLYFIFLGEFLGTIIIYMQFYNFSMLINSKEFAQDIIAIIISCMGCVLIVPISAIVVSILCIRKGKFDSQ